MAAPLAPTPTRGPHPPEPGQLLPDAQGGPAPVVPVALGRAKARRWSGSVPWLFLAPALAVLGTFIFYPAARVFALSFQDYSFVSDAVWIGFRNYGRLWGDPAFRYALLNSLLYLLVTPVLIAASVSVAFLLDTGVRGIRFFRGLYFLPVVTPMIVVGILWGWLLNEDVGLVNYALLALGLVDEKVSWLTSYPLNLFSVMFVTAWKGLGYFAVIFLAGLTTIPKELEEAAALDGASRWQQLFYVKLPLLKPSIALVAVISSISALKVFDELYVMIPGAPAAEKTLVPLIYQTAFLDFRLGYASAISVVLFLMTLAFSFLNLRFFEGKNDA